MTQAMNMPPAWESSRTWQSLVLLAALGDGEVHAVPQLARQTGVGLRRAEILMHALRAHKVVRSVRGRTGGYTLATTPDKISLLSIIQAVDVPEPAPHLSDEAAGVVSHFGALMRDFLGSRTLEDALALTARRTAPSAPTGWASPPPAPAPDPASRRSPGSSAP